MGSCVVSFKRFRNPFGGQTLEIIIVVCYASKMSCILYQAVAQTFALARMWYFSITGGVLDPGFIFVYLFISINGTIVIYICLFISFVSTSIQCFSDPIASCGPS